MNPRRAEVGSDLRRHAVLIVALMMTLLMLLPLRLSPLGRDQANWLTVAMAIEHGRVMYRDIAVVNTPGLGFALATLNVVFNRPELSPWMFHVLTLVGILIGGYTWAWRQFGPWAGRGVAVLLALFLPQTIGWWDLAQKDLAAFSLAVLSGAALTGQQRHPMGDVLAGALFVGAILMKPTAVLYAAPLVVLLSITSDNVFEALRRLLWVFAGIGLMLVPVAVYLTWHEAWAAAWGSLVRRASAYGRLGRETRPYLFAALGGYMTSMLGGLMLAPWLLLRLPISPSAAARSLYPIILVVVTAATFILQGRGWLYHVMPFICACLIAVGACLGGGAGISRVRALIGAVLVAASLVHNWSHYRIGWSVSVQYMLGTISAEQHERIFQAEDMASPKEARDLGAWIRERTDPEDLIFVWGMESQLYLYADRLFVGPSFCDAPIWHPQLARVRPNYYTEQRRRFYAALQQDPPAMFIIAKDDASAVEPTASDEALQELTEIVDFLERHYTTARVSEHFTVLRRNAEQPSPLTE